MLGQELTEAGQQLVVPVVLDPRPFPDGVQGLIQAIAEERGAEATQTPQAALAMQSSLVLVAVALEVSM